MSLPRYAEYKDSGVEWLGEVPAHWRVYPLKRELDFLTSGSRGWAEHYADDGALFIRIGNLTRDSIHLDLTDIQRVAVPDGAEGERTKVQPGDILFSITAYLGSVAVAPDGLEPAFVSQHVALARLRKGNMLPAWTAYVALSWVGKTYLETQGYGGTKVQLSLDDVANLLLTVPPLHEQIAIAAFLDRETAKIDALMAEQDKLLTLLAEKRQATISQAVTTGLDPDVPMKDSGVEWLGQVPGHWQALPLRRLIRTVKTGATPSAVNEFHFDDEGKSWFRPGDFSDDVFLDRAEKCLSEDGLAEVRLFPANTVMHVGIGATIGKVGITTESSSCNQQINAIVCNEKLHHLFAAYFLQSIREFIVRCGKYTTLPIINQDETKALIFAVPPIDEQIQISNYLLREEKTIAGQQRKIKEVVDRLGEYRSALITNAVTGKIDVRDYPVPQTAVEAA